MKNMIYFDTDYMAGAHPKVMERLLQTNSEQTVGYGSDEYTARAKELVKKACGVPDARVYFLVGGTQTNATVIDGVLAHHEGVLAAEMPASFPVEALKAQAVAARTNAMTKLGAHTDSGYQTVLFLKFCTHFKTPFIFYKHI